MPKIHNWKEWGELEEQFNEDTLRDKIQHKSKTHSKNEWEKIDERLQKTNKVKYVKNKRRKAHKKNNHHIS